MVRKFFFITFFLFLLPAQSYCFDSLSVDWGRDSGDEVDLFRAGLRVDTPYQWFESGNWKLGLALELGLMHLESYSTISNDFSRPSDLQAVSFTPVFRLQRTPMPGGAIPYFEAAIGAAFFSEQKMRSSQKKRINFGSTFQFEDIVAAGICFGSEHQYDLSIKFIHYSNFDTGDNNDGIDFTSISFRYHF